MHKISVKYLKPGMIVGRSIYNAQGNALLNRGTSLTSHYIQRLYSLNIPTVYIISRNSNLEITPPPSDVIQEKTRVHATQNVYSVFNQCQMASTLNVGPLKKVASTIIDDLISNKSTLIQISDIRMYDDYTFSHSVNVAVLASMLGTLCRYNKKKLNELTLSALLHDIGKIKIPLEILNKPHRLTSAEEKIIQTHPEEGLRILQQSKLDALIAIVVYEHHEQFTGGGYPRHLASTEIHEYARIITIADVYDALTADRPYKKPYKPHLAYQIMTGYCANHFDPRLLRLFFDHVAIYPVSTILRLKSGYYGVVVKVYAGHTRTPALYMFADERQVPLKTPYLFDWKKEEPDTIEAVMEEYELLQLLDKVKIDPINIMQRLK